MEHASRYVLPPGPGRDTIYDKPMGSYQVELTEEWREFVSFVGDGNMSDGVRTLIEEFRSAPRKPPLDYSLPRRKRMIRTNIRLPDELLEVARRAGRGYYRPGVRAIIRAAMNGHIRPSDRD